MSTCQCHLSLLPDSRFLSLDSDLSGSDSNGGYRQHMSTWKGWLQFFRHSMPSPYDLQRVLDQPMCSMLWLGLTPSSCVVHVCTVSYTFCVIDPVAWGSVTFWWQSCPCNWSPFYTCTRSGLPYNVMHSSSYCRVGSEANDCAVWSRNLG